MKDKISGFVKQVDAFGEEIEEAGIQWLSPKADDHVREIYAHLHAIGGLLDSCLRIAETMEAPDA